MAPQVFRNLQEWREKRRAIAREGLSVGFVPTMGALHAGHVSLLERSRRENDVSILSIYVNPTQFDNKDDLQKYPLTFERDLEAAARSGVDFVLAPTFDQIYPDGYVYKVTENSLSQKLCGAHRPGHFDGVLTVVMKLLNLARADRAYFGEKDFQQLQLVRGMAEAFFMETEIVAVPTMREADGLAMSSRNVNLPVEARKIAPRFFRSLADARSPEEAKSSLEQSGFDIDYIEDIGSRRYGAVRIGGVRLIDNVER